ADARDPGPPADQGPVEPGTAGPFDPGPVADQGPVEPGTAGLRDPGTVTGRGPVEPGTAGARGPGPPALDLDPSHLPPRSRGVIGLLEENCTVCMLCARECPDWCIYIESHKQTVPAPDSGRPRVRNVLDRFAIDFSLCMYCGICIEVCPYDALFWSPEFGYPETGIAGLTHERHRLRGWMQTVRPPPAHDPGAPPPREAQAAGPGAGPAGQPG